MKNLFKVKTILGMVGIIALAAVIGFSFVACENGTTDDGSKNPTVTGVSVTPQTAAVVKGGSQIFTAVVTGENEPSQNVTWTLETSGTAAGTSIDANGKLTVDTNETKTKITVKAAAAADTSKSATAQVTVAAPNNSITSVTVTPETVSVQKGKTQTFTAVVAGANNPVQTVTWTIETAGVAAGTSIDADGKLTVDANESLNQLTVKAASTVNPSKSGVAAVTLQSGPVPTVTNVTVTPETVSVEKGKTQTFTAVVTGTNNPATTVTWTIETTDVAAGTSIDATGVLTVDKDETLSGLTVKAVSTVDTTRSGTATVTLTEATLTWKKANFSFDGDHYITKVVYGNNKWLALGLSGNGSNSIMAISTDGVTWSLIDAPPFYAYNSNLFYDGAKWIQISWGTTYTSIDDGITWTTTTNNATDYKSVVYNGTTYVGIGRNDVVVSKDCITWTRKAFSTYELNSVAYSDGRWLIAADSNSVTSTDDGETWTNGDGYGTSIAYGGGTWVTVWDRGSIKTSTDGLTWTGTECPPTMSPYIMKSVVYGGKTFAVVAADRIAISSDGKIWTETNYKDEIAHPTIRSDVNAIAYGDGKFVVGGAKAAGYIAYAVVE